MMDLSGLLRVERAVFQLRSKVSHRVSKEEWESQTVRDLQKQLKKVHEAHSTIVNLRDYQEAVVSRITININMNRRLKEANKELLQRLNLKI